MASGLYIDARQLQKGAKGFERLIKEFPEHVSDVLEGNAEEIVRVAKDTVRSNSADRGGLAQGISFTNDNPLQKHITSRAPYSAYVEFGTGKYAAQEVSKYPADYQTFAAQFKRGRRWPPIDLIKEWILRKGIVASFNIQTRKRVGRGNSKAEQARAEQMAYVIARSIFINGTHAHPFMIPALIKQTPVIIRDMLALLNRLKIV